MMQSGERSRRQDRATQTRLALIDAALNLFSTNGYDQTTTDQIADGAGVSPRTFFRYFPTKESVLFFGEYDFVRAFSGVYLAQPDSMSELDAMANAFITLAPGLSRLRTRITLYREAVASSVRLIGKERKNHDASAKTVADAIASRRQIDGPDEECMLVASVGMLVVERSIDRWIRSPASTAPEDVVRSEFTSLRILLGVGGVTAP